MTREGLGAWPPSQSDEYDEDGAEPREGGRWRARPAAGPRPADPEAERAAAYRSLVRATVRLGYPEEFAYVMSRELRGARELNQMAAYLTSDRPGSPQEIADELLSIVQLRNAWIEQKRSERAEAAINEWYERPDRPDPLPDPAPDSADGGRAGDGAGSGESED